MAACTRTARSRELCRTNRLAMHFGRSNRRSIFEADVWMPVGTSPQMAFRWTGENGAFLSERGSISAEFWFKPEDEPRLRTVSTHDHAGIQNVNAAPCPGEFTTLIPPP